MAEEPSYMKWVQPADDLVRQAYYRILGAISFHAPMEEALLAIKHLAETKRGGTLEPVKDFGLFRVWSWNGLEAYPGLMMDLWIVASPYSNNTAYLRKRWWKLYLVEAVAKVMFRRLG